MSSTFFPRSLPLSKKNKAHGGRQLGVANNAYRENYNHLPSSQTVSPYFFPQYAYSSAGGGWQTQSGNNNFDQIAGANTLAPWNLANAYSTYYNTNQSYSSSNQQSSNYGQYYGNTGYPSSQQQQSYGRNTLTGYSSMDYSQWSNSQYGNTQQNYQYPPGYNAYGQQQQYQPTPPQIRNPFAPPPVARSQYSTQNVEQDLDYEAQLAQWQSAYAPQDPYEKGRKGGKPDKGENPNYTNLGIRQAAVANTAENGGAKLQDAASDKRTVVRKGGGETWQDDTLLEWDPNQFRIMVGNLAGEVTDDSLFKAFASYGPSKARVVRDKRTTKSKGFGFVAFTDADKGFNAAKEMTGKYIGSHPVTIQRSKTDVRSSVKKDKNKNKKKDKEAKGNDPLRAHTGATIEKKPVKNPSGYKMLG